MDKKRIGILATLAAVALLVVALRQAEHKAPVDADIAAKDEEMEMDMEWIRGFNAAISQFAPIERVDRMTIKAQKTKAYTSSEEEKANIHPKPRQPKEDEGSYATGYHQALEMLTEKVYCPRL